jgi:hypothetical protein
LQEATPVTTRPKFNPKRPLLSAAQLAAWRLEKEVNSGDATAVQDAAGNLIKSLVVLSAAVQAKKATLQAFTFLKPNGLKTVRKGATAHCDRFHINRMCSGAEG